MTTTFETQEQVSAGRHVADVSGVGKTITARAHLSNWLADQWPRAAILFAVVVTCGWVIFLVWVLGFLASLF